jgi:hypothetical protein
MDYIYMIYHVFITLISCSCSHILSPCPVLPTIPDTSLPCSAGRSPDAASCPRIEYVVTRHEGISAVRIADDPWRVTSALGEAVGDGTSFRAIMGYDKILSETHAGF